MFHPIVFISLGSGDPDLITLKGFKALREADLIFCPSTLTNNGKTFSRATDILLELGIDRSKIKQFNLSMGKERSSAIEVYRKVTEEIKELQKLKYKIAVTAEGDAGFYSSVHYIIDNLRNIGIPIKRISGVPAFIACGALANIHIAKQEEEVNIIPGIVSLDMLKNNMNTGKVQIIMKASQCENVIKQIVDMQDITIHYFENVGVSDREYYTSDKQEILSRNFPYFSLIIIHKKSI